MGKRDKKMNLGLPREIHRLIVAESDRTGDYQQDVVRDALREYFAERDISSGIEGQIAELENRVDEIDDQIDEKRDELRDLQDERDEVRDQLAELKDQLDTVGDDVTGVEDAIERIGEAAAECVGERDERVLVTDSVVDEAAEQLGMNRVDLLEQAYAEYPEIPRSCWDGGVILDAERYDDREHAVDLAIEYIESEGYTERVREMIDEAAQEFDGVERHEMKDEIKDVLGEDVFSPTA